MKKDQHKEWCSIKTQAEEVEEHRSSETLKVQRDTALSNPLRVWSWPRGELEVGPDDLQKEGRPFLTWIPVWL